MDVKAILAVCIAACLAGISLPAATPYVDIQISASTVKPGTDVIVRCRITGGGPGTFVSWKKRQGAQESLLGTNTYLEPQYEITDRYMVEFQDQLSQGYMLFILTIKDTRLEDSGMIGCAPPGGEVKFVKLDVVLPVEELHLFSTDANGTLTRYTDGQTAVFPLDGAMRFGCRANGSSPAAEVTATLAGEDLKSILEVSYQVYALDDLITSQGLVRRLHTTQIENKKFPITISQKHDGMKLVCRATLPLSILTQTSITIEVHGEPNVTCIHVTSPLNARNVRLVCKVDGTPEMTHVQWTWTDAAGENRTLLPGENWEGYSTHSDNQQGVHTLIINRAHEHTFRSYHLTATNRFGTATGEVHLMEGSAGGAQQLAVTSSVAIVSLLFATVML